MRRMKEWHETYRIILLLLHKVKCYCLFWSYWDRKMALIKKLNSVNLVQDSVISGIPPPFPRNSVKNTSHKICHHKKKGVSDQKYEFTIEFIKIGHKNHRYNVLQMRPTHSTSLNNGLHLLGSNGMHSVSCPHIQRVSEKALARTEKTVIMQWHGCCAILLHECAWAVNLFIWFITLWSNELLGALYTQDRPPYARGDTPAFQQL